MGMNICPICKYKTEKFLCRCGYNFAAASLGRKGGQSKSKLKQKSSRENGKLGGRPKKIK
jgi:hypothetical protein